MGSNEPIKKPLLTRPGFWVVAGLIAVFLFSNINAFPAGRYECTWSGARPGGELEGDLVVTVGTWPATYPLKARIYTATGPVEVVDWTHAHSTWAREFHATVPIKSREYQALCEPA